MQTIVLTRRAALIALGAGAAFGVTACNTTQTAAVQPQAAPSGPRISAIEVNTAPLIAQSGNPTAGWVQQQLPGLLAQDLAANMAPGDPGAATLRVRINSIYLGGGGPADPDRMRGVATLSGSAAGQIRLRATSTYIPSPVDQALVEQAMQARVSELSQAFAYWLKRKMGFRREAGAPGAVITSAAKRSRCDGPSPTIVWIASSLRFSQ